MVIYLTNHHSSLKCKWIYSFVFKSCWFILSLITINTITSPGPDKSSEIQSSHLSNVAQENRSRSRTSPEGTCHLAREMLDA